MSKVNPAPDVVRKNLIPRPTKGLARNGSARLTRRDFFGRAGALPFLILPPPFSAQGLRSPAEVPPLTGSEGLLHPCAFDFRYRAPDPLSETLRHVTPGQDGFITEVYAAEIEAELARWVDGFGACRYLSAVLDFPLAEGFEAFDPAQIREEPVRSEPDLNIVRRRFSEARRIPRPSFLGPLENGICSFGILKTAEFKLTGIELIQESPLVVRTEILYDLVGNSPTSGIEQRVGTWRMEWRRNEAKRWQVTRWEAGVETCSRAPRRLFSDVSESAFGAIASYREQMLPSIDTWRSRLDAAWGIDVYGNSGLAVGDYVGDGFDDIYICEPAGLPNRLYRNRGDGTFEDATESAGVGVLDNTASALFVDLLNRGRQDLIVVRAAGPLLFLNQGGGRFELKPNAFQFAQPPAGTFTAAAAADYDGDGRLDVYFCLYSYYLGLGQYNYPIPYYDAQNGPPNFLLQNEGDGTFRDVTTKAGLSENNNRYSFACGWADFNGDGRPDLYVVNDFGRKNLYRNNGDGTFTDIAAKAGVEDYGAGMSVSWLDYDNDGKLDLYVGDMWTAAGERVTAQTTFQPKAPENLRAVFRKHTAGNALYRNSGDETFQDATSSAGVAKGRWAWCSDAWDFDHDGFPDLYIADGFISGSDRRELQSFFWRQVVANSPLAAKASPAYERGWNAINELIRSDGTWAGYERNVFYANNRDGTFSDISGVAGLDFIEDSRAFGLADFDHDGRLEIVLKNRNAPRLRLLSNEMENLGDVIAVSLRGTKGNRDAIGAVVTVEAGKLRQTKTLQAGSGFLTQHAKGLTFGLGRNSGKVRLAVRWPSGTTQTFENLPPNQRVRIEEGRETFHAEPFAPWKPAPPVIYDVLSNPSSRDRRETWLIDLVAAPEFTLPDFEDRKQTLKGLLGHPALLTFWDADCPESCEQQTRVQDSLMEFQQASWGVLAISPGDEASAAKARAFVREKRLTFPQLIADADVLAVYDLVFRYLLDRHADMAPPASFLLDEQGRIIKAYQGLWAAETFLKDWESRPRNVEERLRRSRPFEGTYYGSALRRNFFTYGVAFFNRGYTDQALGAFEQALAAKPDDADAYYNIGTLYLRKKMYAEARSNLERAVKLKPEYPNAWNNLGMISAEEGKPDEAIEDFKRAIEQSSGDAISRSNLGYLYVRLSRTKEAEAVLLQAVELAPNDPDVVYSLGMLYAGQNDSTRASKYLERAVELRHTFPNALNNLGVLRVRAGDSDGAEREFKECIRVAPDYAQAYLNLAELEAGTGRKEQARALLREFLERHPDNQAVAEALRELN